jgi:hypothetical protein
MTQRLCIPLSLTPSIISSLNPRSRREFSALRVSQYTTEVSTPNPIYIRTIPWPKVYQGESRARYCRKPIVEGEGPSDVGRVNLRTTLELTAPLRLPLFFSTLVSLGSEL